MICNEVVAVYARVCAAANTVRRCVTGCIATMCLMLPDWKPGSALGARRR
jgi:hypothetical protein